MNEDEKEELILSICSDVLILLRLMVKGADDFMEFTVIPKDRTTMRKDEVIKPIKPKNDSKKKKYKKYKTKWTVDDVDYLSENYGTVPPKLIAKKLGKTRSSVVSKASSMGIGGGIKNVKVLDCIRTIKAGTSADIANNLEVAINKVEVTLTNMVNRGLCRKFVIKSGENNVIDMLFAPYLEKHLYYFIAAELEDWCDERFPKELGGNTIEAREHIMKNIGKIHDFDCKCDECTKIRKTIVKKVNSGQIHLSGTEADKRKIMETDK